MQLKIGLFSKGVIEFNLCDLTIIDNVRLHSIKHFYDKCHEYDLSVIYPFFLEDQEMVLNFITTQIDSHIILVNQGNEIASDSFLREIKNVHIIEINQIKDSIKEVIKTIKIQKHFNEKLCRFLFDMVRDNELSLDKKKEIFNKLESLKYSIESFSKDIA